MLAGKTTENVACCRVLCYARRNHEENIMKPLPIVASALLATASIVFGQGMPGPQYNPTTARMARLFGLDAGFTATALSSTIEGKTETVTEMDYAVRGGMVRIEMDLTKTKKLRNGKPIKQRDDDMEGMASMGMNKQVTLVRPDKQATYIVYPGLKAYAQAPKKASDGQSKSDWKEIGKDTVDGHPCVKYEVTATNADGSTEVSTAWKATDLKDFIIQTVNGDTTLKFSNVKFEKPAAAIFDLPADYKQYGSIQEMMMGAMQQMMQNASGQ